MIAELALTLGIVANAHAQVASYNIGPDNWAAIGDGIRGANGPVSATTTDAAGNVYVAGNFTVIGDVVANGIAKWDGTNWSALGSGMDNQVLTLSVPGTDLYAGGIFTKAGGVEANGVARWDGTNWSALGTGILGTEVSKVAVMGDTLYAGGSFTNAGGVAVNNIARWDGTNWSALGSGVDGWVSTMLVDGTNLYVGGQFSTAGGVAADLIAKWDGNTWSSLGFNGGSGIVRSLCMFQSNLYASGDFSGAESDIAKWDGTNWTSVGSGVSGTVVWAMTVTQNALYVGGNFSGAGGISVTNIAKWDGTSWSAVGTGAGELNSGSGIVAVRTLTAAGDNLIAGGELLEAGGEVANRIAQWDGTNWFTFGSATFTNIPNFSFESVGVDQPTGLAASGGDVYVVEPGNRVVKWDGSAWSGLGSGLGGGVFSVVPYPWRNIAVSGSDVYVTGGFDTAGGIPAHYIAKWDGTSWSALGSGLDDLAIVLVASGTNLYAGGRFTSAGGNVANHIARWDGSQWSSLGSGMSGVVASILVSGTNVYAGGSFTTAGERQRTASRDGMASNGRHWEAGWPTM